jgi:hypothetical protein
LSEGSCFSAVGALCRLEDVTNVGGLFELLSLNLKAVRSFSAEAITAFFFSKGQFFLTVFNKGDSRGFVVRSDYVFSLIEFSSS